MNKQFNMKRFEDKIQHCRKKKCKGHFTLLNEQKLFRKNVFLSSFCEIELSMYLLVIQSGNIFLKNGMASHKNILTTSTIMYSKFYPRDIISQKRLQYPV